MFAIVMIGSNAHPPFVFVGHSHSTHYGIHACARQVQQPEVINWQKALCKLNPFFPSPVHVTLSVVGMEKTLKIHIAAKQIYFIQGLQ